MEEGKQHKTGGREWKKEEGLVYDYLQTTCQGERIITDGCIEPTERISHFSFLCMHLQSVAWSHLNVEPEVGEVCTK